MSIEENTYLCLKCRNLFTVELNNSISNIKCPKCESTQVDKLPSWAPIGSSLTESQPDWEYECQNCHHTFKLPVPTSPSQEKEIKCPKCQGNHIHRLTLTGGEPLYCG